eukprot:SAG31_NODE_8026_length_1538_cov_1.631689_1_plen_114_part_00
MSCRSRIVLIVLEVVLFDASLHASDTREAFNRTVIRAIETGEPCSTKPCIVTPWLSLGSGFKRGAPFKLEGKYLYPSPYSYTMSWDYESIYSWQLGAEINQATKVCGILSEPI